MMDARAQKAAKKNASYVCGNTTSSPLTTSTSTPSLSKSSASVSSPMSSVVNSSASVQQKPKRLVKRINIYALDKHLPRTPELKCSSMPLPSSLHIKPLVQALAKPGLPPIKSAWASRLVSSSSSSVSVQSLASIIAAQTATEVEKATALHKTLQQTLQQTLQKEEDTKKLKPYSKVPTTRQDQVSEEELQKISDDKKQQVEEQKKKSNTRRDQQRKEAEKSRCLRDARLQYRLERCREQIRDERQCAYDISKSLSVSVPSHMNPEKINVYPWKVLHVVPEFVYTHLLNAWLTTMVEWEQETGRQNYLYRLFERRKEQATNQLHALTLLIDQLKAFIAEEMKEDGNGRGRGRGRGRGDTSDEDKSSVINDKDTMKCEELPAASTNIHNDEDDDDSNNNNNNNNNSKTKNDDCTNPYRISSAINKKQKPISTSNDITRRTEDNNKRGETKKETIAHQGGFSRYYREQEERARKIEEEQHAQLIREADTLIQSLRAQGSKNVLSTEEEEKLCVADEAHPRGYSFVDANDFEESVLWHTEVSPENNVQKSAEKIVQNLRLWRHQPRSLHVRAEKMRIEVLKQKSSAREVKAKLQRLGYHLSRSATVTFQWRNPFTKQDLRQYVDIDCFPHTKLSTPPVWYLNMQSTEIKAMRSIWRTKFAITDIEVNDNDYFDDPDQSLEKYTKDKNENIKEATKEDERTETTRVETPKPKRGESKDEITPYTASSSLLSTSASTPASTLASTSTSPTHISQSTDDYTGSVVVDEEADKDLFSIKLEVSHYAISYCVEDDLQHQRPPKCIYGLENVLHHMEADRYMDSTRCSWIRHSYSYSEYSKKWRHVVRNCKSI